MQKKYINEYRYKKGTNRKRRDSSTVKSNLKSNTIIKKVNPVKKNSNKRVKKINKKRKANKNMNLFIAIGMLIVIGIISRFILKGENESFVQFSFTTKSNENNIFIGVITEDSLLNDNSSNIVLNELRKYSKDTMLEINEDYNITYKCISSIVKISNNEYNIITKKNSKITADVIKNTLDSYRQDKNSIYYNKLNNIENITKTDENTIKIKLLNDDEYFIYKLNISLNTNFDKTNYIKDDSSTDNKLILNRHKNADKNLPIKVVVKKYKNMYEALEAYKSDEIDIFVTNSGNVENMLGKHEYNIKSYRNGKCVFLFGNPEFELYQKKEVRKAIAYSIDRDSIIKNVLNFKGDKIDLPYIYDICKYKYDVYATENLLLTNKYKKVDKLYIKNENGVKTVLELNLIVSRLDDIKISIAQEIQNNLSSVGIRVNIEKLSDSEIENRLNNNSYDLILANVNLNNDPNISFIQDKLYLTDDEINSISSFKTSNIESIKTGIQNIQNGLSENISVIGIYSDISYIIYNKDVIGIDNVSYMNLFKDLLE